MLFLTEEIILKCSVCVGCIVSASALFFSTVSVGCSKINKKIRKKTKEKKGERGNGIKGKGEKNSLAWTFQTISHMNKDRSMIYICCHSDMTN